MGNLISDTYTFTDLANRYGNFLVPAFQILIDGQNVLGENKISVGNLQIYLSLHYASSAAFEITGAYDQKERTFLDSVKHAVSPGKTIEVQVGYLSAFETVFQGYIASASMNVSENPYLSITAMDAKRLMMDGYRERYFDDESYAGIVAAVMDEYASLCSLEENTAEGSLTKKVYQKGSDFTFLTDHISKVTDKEFLLFCGKGYFRTPKGTAAELITLEYGKSLLSFTKQSDYLDLHVVATGYDKKEQVFLIGESSAKTAKDGILTSPPSEISIYSDTDNIKDLSAIADHIAREKESKAKSGFGRCIGLPQIVPGRLLKIENTDSLMNGTYYVIEVRHRIDGQGFITEFKTEG